MTAMGAALKAAGIKPGACVRKRQFSRRQDAERYANRGNENGWKLYVYRCESCGHLHLTKMIVANWR